ncbi:MAG: GerMN domain-containing protein [Clostridia bacterium]|nr:GerMN domain-containing protein [Clostridia bacterium]
MKKKVLPILLAVLVLLCACHVRGEKNAPEHPFAFYYARSKITYQKEDSVICAETREYDPQTMPLEKLLSSYFEGPASSELSMPFPANTQVLSCQKEGTSVTLSMNEPYMRLSGINKSVADACLAKTLLGCGGIERVTILAPDDTMTTLTQKNLVFTDTGAQVQDTSVTLYFADAENRFLLPEQRSTEPLEEPEIPRYIVSQLIAGTQQRGYGNTIPAGTRLLGIKTENGVCTVDFSAEFLTNSPQMHFAERMTVYSIVNSLTELDAVSSVQIVVEGEIVDFFSRMSLAEPISRENTMIGPVKAASGEICASLCVYDGQQLLPISMILPATENENEAETVLQALIGFEPYNVYRDLFPEDTVLRSIQVDDRLCRVDLSGEGLKALPPEQMQIALRSIVATLCMNDVADMVLLTVDGAAPAAEFERPVSAEADWVAD